MKSLLPRALACALLAVVSWLVLAGAAAKPETRERDKLVILSTTDVKGKTSPCG